VCTLRRILAQPKCEFRDSFGVSGVSHTSDRKCSSSFPNWVAALHLAPSEDLGLAGARPFGWRLGSGSQLLAAEGVAASAWQLHCNVRLQRTGSPLRLPTRDKFPLAVGQVMEVRSAAAPPEE